MVSLSKIFSSFGFGFDVEWKQMSKCHELSGTEIFFPEPALIRKAEKLSFWQDSSIISTNLSLFTANEAWIRALLSVLRFVARFPSLYLGSEGRGASMTWINGTAAGESRGAAPAGARPAGAVRAHRAAGQRSAGTECPSLLPPAISLCSVPCVATVGLDHLFQNLETEKFNGVY